ncbi:MAG TPA: hypothetical protein VFX30_12255 [bacterium]|nr:hypothetical protein [bacterium]
MKILAKLPELLNGGEIRTAGKRQILSYMDALAVLVEDYEKKAFSSNLDGISGKDVLEYLMEEHSLKQSDLSKELGSQSVVSPSAFFP